MLRGTRRRSELHPHIWPRCAWRRHRPDLKNAIACYRVGDVLQVLLAKAVEPNGKLVVDLIIDRAGYQDSPRFGQLLQSRGDIDAVAIDIIALHHHVAQMDPDAESHPSRLRQPAVVGGELLLRLDRALHGLDNAGELGNDGVAPGVDDAPIMALSASPWQRGNDATSPACPLRRPP